MAVRGSSGLVTSFSGSGDHGVTVRKSARPAKKQSVSSSTVTDYSIEISAKCKSEGTRIRHNAWRCHSLVAIRSCQSRGRSVTLHLALLTWH